MMANEGLTVLLIQLGGELARFLQDADETALHSSTLCADNQALKEAVDQAISLWICEGKWTPGLSGSLRFSVWNRFFFAFAVLSECLWRRDRSAFVELLRASWFLAKPHPEPLSDFDDSVLADDRDTVLRTLLIRNWNKVNDSDLAKLGAACLEMIPNLAGFRQVRPGLGLQDRLD